MAHEFPALESAGRPYAVRVGVLIVYSVPLPVRKEGFNKLARVWMSVEYPPTTIHS